MAANPLRITARNDREPPTSRRSVGASTANCAAHNPTSSRERKPLEIEARMRSVTRSETRELTSRLSGRAVGDPPCRIPDGFEEAATPRISSTT